MKTLLKFLYSIVLLKCSLSALNCAGEAPPSGGPVDTTPPKIIATYPEPNTVEFSGNRITIQFDEHVDPRSVEESIFISPHLGILEFDWSGKTVEIRFSEQLRPATTYVLTVGTDVVDVRNRNRMESSFSLAFSTGVGIDSGIIRGRVYDEKPEGVMVFAYRFDSATVGSLSPSEEKPHYLTQTGKAGFFELSHLAFGTYRLFAIRDQFKNLLYDPTVDDVGVYSRDIVIDSHHPRFNEVKFQLTKEDTTRPQLFEASAPDERHVLLRFSEPLDPSRASPGSVEIQDTVNATPLTVHEAFVDLTKPSTMVLVTAAQSSGRVYRVSVDNVYDVSGNRINPVLNRAVFPGSSRPDTAAPRPVFFSISDSARQIPLRPRVTVYFDDAVRKQGAEAALQLVDSTGKMVVGSFRWETSAALGFLPNEDLLSKAWYNLRLRLDDIMDMAGNRLSDSVIVRRFETLDRASLGSLEGELIDETGGRDSTAYILRVAGVGQNRKSSYEAKLHHPGRFEMTNLTEGFYVLSVSRDDDNNGRYSFGRPIPFQPSEIFSFYPDTLRIRARWPLQGVVIHLK